MEVERTKVDNSEKRLTWESLEAALQFQSESDAALPCLRVDADEPSQDGLVEHVGYWCHGVPVALEHLGENTGVVVICPAQVQVRIYTHVRTYI